MTHAMLALILRLIGVTVIAVGTSLAVAALWPLAVGTGVLLTTEGLLMECDL